MSPRQGLALVSEQVAGAAARLAEHPCMEVVRAVRPQLSNVRVALISGAQLRGTGGGHGLAVAWRACCGLLGSSVMCVLGTTVHGLCLLVRVRCMVCPHAGSTARPCITRLWIMPCLVQLTEVSSCSTARATAHICKPPFLPMLCMMP